MVPTEREDSNYRVRICVTAPSYCISDIRVSLPHLLLVTAPSDRLHAILVALGLGHPLPSTESVAIVGLATWCNCSPFVSSCVSNYVFFCWVRIWSSVVECKFQFPFDTLKHA